MSGLFFSSSLSSPQLYKQLAPHWHTIGYQLPYLFWGSILVGHRLQHLFLPLHPSAGCRTMLTAMICDYTESCLTIQMRCGCLSANAHPLMVYPSHFKIRNSSTGDFLLFPYTLLNSSQVNIWYYRSLILIFSQTLWTSFAWPCLHQRNIDYKPIQLSARTTSIHRTQIHSKAISQFGQKNPLVKLIGSVFS